MSDPVASDAFAFVARMAISRASWTAVLTSPAWVVPLKKRYSTVCLPPFQRLWRLRARECAEDERVARIGGKPRRLQSDRAHERQRREVGASRRAGDKISVF